MQQAVQEGTAAPPEIPGCILQSTHISVCLVHQVLKVGITETLSISLPKSVSQQLPQARDAHGPYWASYTSRLATFCSLAEHRVHQSAGATGSLTSCS